MSRRLRRLLTWRRARAYALVLLTLYVVAWITVVSQGNPPLNSAGVPIAGDFIAFQAAGRLLLTGNAPAMYDHDTVVAVQDHLLGGRVPNFYDAYRNPPFFALIYAPLSALDLLPAFALWFALQVAFLALAMRVLLEETPSLQPRWRGLLILVLAFPPVYFGLIDGENATLSLLLFALIYRYLARGNDVAVGVVAALGLFKPQLFVVFPLVFLLTRRWRALASYAATAVALAAISLVLVGPEGVQAWLRILLDPEGGNATVNGWRMASAKAFFDALLPSFATASLVLYALLSVVVLAALASVWTLRRNVTLPVAFALTCLVAVLIDPHLVDYDLTVLAAAAIVAASLVPRLAWAIVPLYIVTLLRASIPVGEVSLQLTAPLLLACAVCLYLQYRREVRCAAWL